MFYENTDKAEYYSVKQLTVMDQGWSIFANKYFAK